MKLKIKEYLNYEIVHHYESDNGDEIKSTGNMFFVRLSGEEFSFSIPGQLKFLMRYRIIRRFLRYDKSNAVFNWKRDGIIILFQWKIYFYDLIKRELVLVDQLKQCRNVLHNGISVTSSAICFGEYGHNPNREPVPIWKSNDDGRSFSIAQELVQNQIKHIHGIYDDKFSDSLWIVTGDFDGECYVIESKDSTFSNLKWYGDGSQKWRPVSIFFNLEEIIWVMDSPIQKAYLQIFNRKDKTLAQGQYFPGPVWYSKQFENGDAVLQTSVEIGKEVKSSLSKIFYSKNLKDWEEVYNFKKDIFPMPYFKFGVVAFAEGRQTKEDFVLFGEGLKDIDGRSAKVSL